MLPDKRFLKKPKSQQKTLPLFAKIAKKRSYQYVLSLYLRKTPELQQQKRRRRRSDFIVYVLRSIENAFWVTLGIEKTSPRFHGLFEQLSQLIIHVDTKARCGGCSAKYRYSWSRDTNRRRFLTQFPSSQERFSKVKTVKLTMTFASSSALGFFARKNVLRCSKRNDDPCISRQLQKQQKFIEEKTETLITIRCFGLSKENKTW